jgi:hypothetical protein
MPKHELEVKRPLRGAFYLKPIPTETGTNAMDIDTRGDQIKRLADHAVVAVTLGSDGGPRPLRPARPTSSEFGSTQTANPGTGYTALAADQAAEQVVVSNNTGTTLQFRKNGNTFLLPTGIVHTFRALENLNEIEVRRADTSNTQVTVTWEAESF